MPQRQSKQGKRKGEAQAGADAEEAKQAEAMTAPPVAREAAGERA